MITRRTALATLLAAAATPALASRPEIYKSNENVAVNGYDVTAYFTEANHVQGLPEFSAEWLGATWLFASAEGLARFTAAPESYAPQYGGHCAYAASKNALASTVPEAWTIIEGKLYLNFSLGVRDLWRRDFELYIEQANANWPGLHG